MNILKTTTVAALTVGLVSQASATEGINLIGIGPVQQGTAGAGVASAKDSTWSILNPAGITELENSIDASFQVFAPVRTIDSNASGGAGKQSDESAFVIPSLSGSFQVSENGFVGIGLHGTSGMGVDYNYGRIGAGAPPFTPQTDGDTMTELSVAKLTAIYAHKFGDSGFSLGAGPVLVLSRLRTDMLNPATFTYSGGDWDNALGAGAIIGFNQELGRVSIGGSYMSEQWVEEFDDYNDLLGGSLNLPQQLTLGAAIDVLENLELAVDYRWVGWNELDTLGDTFGWDNQHIVKAGLTWDVSEAWTLRTGISHGNSPIDSDSAFGNGLFPAIVETHLALGASYAWEKWAVHAAYIHALENSVTANGNDSGPLQPLADGTEITMYQNSLTAGVSYRF
ncbi:outer membrane protein transport protein [Pontiellaceae bacterium B12227]|nr:outer membrane protein transport protein [Pontiellaceae bacterium B12227]